jgi:hypothetical protein
LGLMGLGCLYDSFALAIEPCIFGPNRRLAKQEESSRPGIPLPPFLLFSRLAFRQRRLLLSTSLWVATQCSMPTFSLGNAALEALRYVEPRLLLALLRELAFGSFGSPAHLFLLCLVLGWVLLGHVEPTRPRGCVREPDCDDEFASSRGQETRRHGHPDLLHGRTFARLGSPIH